MFRWDSADGSTTVYYALEGMGCCFCPSGSDLIAWTAPTPLGPWTPVRQLRHHFGPLRTLFPTRCRPPRAV